MSSFFLDASGKRAVSATLNDDARTAVSIPSKAGDDARIQLNSFEEVAMYVPATARLELVHVPHEKDDGYDEFIRLVLPGGSVSIDCRAGEGGGGWPHVGVYVRKDAAADFYFANRGAEVASSVPLAAAVLAKVEVVDPDAA